MSPTELYDLASVKGAPLPFDDRSVGAASPHKVTERGTPELRGDGLAYQIWRGHYVRADGTTPAFVDSRSGTRSASGDTVVTDALVGPGQRYPWVTYRLTDSGTLASVSGGSTSPLLDVVYHRR